MFLASTQCLMLPYWKINRLLDSLIATARYVERGSGDLVHRDRSCRIRTHMSGASRHHAILEWKSESAQVLHPYIKDETRQVLYENTLNEDKGSRIFVAIQGHRGDHGPNLHEHHLRVMSLEQTT
jgi:hypothetical protein